MRQRSGKSRRGSRCGAAASSSSFVKGLTDPIGEFIDSDEAVRLAKQNGLTGSDKPMLGLAWMGGSKDGLACWTVGGGFEPGAVAIVLNAKTGELVTKHEAK